MKLANERDGRCQPVRPDMLATTIMTTD